MPTLYLRRMMTIIIIITTSTSTTITDSSISTTIVLCTTMITRSTITTSITRTKNNYNHYDSYCICSSFRCEITRNKILMHALASKRRSNCTINETSLGHGCLKTAMFHHQRKNTEFQHKNKAGNNI